LATFLATFKILSGDMTAHYKRHCRCFIVELMRAAVPLSSGTSRLFF
jgi:hypothetical protein